MSRTYTRGELRTRSLFLANALTSATGFYTTANIDDLINVHSARVYDLLVEAGPPDYFSLTASVTTNPFTVGSAIRSLTGVFATESNGRSRKLLPMPDAYLDRFVAAPAAITATVEYIPVLPIIATGGGNDSTTFDGISGWEELICLRVARDILTRERQDVSNLQGQIIEYEANIKSSARKHDRSGSYPIAIVDFCARDWWPWTNQLAHYRLRGASVEFFVGAVGW